jgi:hypothetical protein
MPTYVYEQDDGWNAAELDGLVDWEKFDEDAGLGNAC